MSDKQTAANQQNALKSTGAKSIEGKQIVSGNRITHGILSTKLLLADESVDDYQALLDDLQTQLKPVGTLEQTLVERIAVCFWRQQRLVRAETAAITIKMTQSAILEKVNDGMGIGRYSDDKITGKDLEPPDQEQVKWCNDVIAEAEQELQLEQLQKQAPLIYKQLSDDSKSDDMGFSEYLNEHHYGNLTSYVSNLLSWCRNELKKAEQHDDIVQLADTAKDSLCLPWGQVDIFTKYQASLDNQTYKAMKALREAQDWRLKTLDEVEDIEMALNG